MGKLGSKKLIMLFLISAAVGLCMQLPFLRNAYYDQMMTALSLTDTQMGILASTIGITCTVCYPISGLLANRFKAKPLMCVSMFGIDGICIIFGYVSNFYVLMVLHVLLGIFNVGTLWSAYLTVIRGLGDESVQGQLYGWSEASRGIAQTIMGFVFVALIAQAATPAMSWRMIMLYGSGVLIVLAIICVIVLPNESKTVTAKKAQDKTENNEEQYTIMDVLKNKGVWIVILLITCAYASWSLGQSYLTSYSIRVVGVSETLASTLGVIRSYVIVVVAGFLGGWILDKFTYKGKGFIFLLGLTAASFAGVMLTNKILAVSIALSVLIAFLANVMKATFFSTLGQAGIPPKMTALATGVISTLVYFLPDTALPPVCGAWIDQAAAAGNVAAGFHKIFILLIVFSVVGVFASILLLRRTKELERSGELARIIAASEESK